MTRLCTLQNLEDRIEDAVRQVKRASLDLMTARDGMVRREELEAMLESRVVSHEVHVRHLRERMMVRRPHTKKSAVSLASGETAR